MKHPLFVQDCFDWHLERERGSSFRLDLSFIVTLEKWQDVRYKHLTELHDNLGGCHHVISM